MTAPNPALPLDPKVGYFLFAERNGADSIVWADNSFFRLNACPSLKSLTPIKFQPLATKGYKVGKAETTYAQFLSVLYDSDPTPTPFIAGTFTKKANDQMIFCSTPAASPTSRMTHIFLRSCLSQSPSSSPRFPTSKKFARQVEVIPPTASQKTTLSLMSCSTTLLKVLLNPLLLLAYKITPSFQR